jgi:hypothetical protein
VNLTDSVIAGNRWLRGVHTGAGGSAAGQAVCVILLFNPSAFPVTQVNAIGAAV